METKGGYVVRFSVPNAALTVDVNGKPVPMAQFPQTHTPIQVTSFTHVSHGGTELTVLALMIAEETEPAPASTGAT
jgi:hypothetical protein